MRMMKYENQHFVSKVNQNLFVAALLCIFNHIAALIDAALTSQQRGEFCLGCYAEIAPDEHPLFNGKMCNGCKVNNVTNFKTILKHLLQIRIKHSMHAYGDDGIAVSECCFFVMLILR